jgi:hypothetical protein
MIALFTSLFVWFGISTSKDLALSAEDVQRATVSNKITLIGNIKDIVKNGGERFKTRIITESGTVVDIGMDYQIAKLFNAIHKSNIDIMVDTDSNIYCLTYHKNKQCTFGLPVES